MIELGTAFRAAVEALHGACVPYAFIGALPAIAWGRVRATTDLDLVVHIPEGFAALGPALLARGFSRGAAVGEPAEPGGLPDIAIYWWGAAPSVRLDVFLAKTRFEEAVLVTAREADILGLRVRLARPEASIVYKLLASRRKDLDDVEAIFEGRSLAGEPLDWAFLEYWCGEWDIQERLAPYRARFGPSVGP
jgi:hypothetical protein